MSPIDHRPARRLGRPLPLCALLAAGLLAVSPVAGASAADTPAPPATPASTQAASRDGSLLALISAASTLSPGILTPVAVPGSQPPLSIRVRSNPDTSIAVSGIPGVTTVLLRPSTTNPAHIAIDQDGDGTIDEVLPVLADGLGTPLPRSAWPALGLPALLTSEAIPSDELAVGNQGEGDTALGNLGGDRPGAIPGGTGGGFGGIIGENNSNAVSPTRP